MFSLSLFSPRGLIPARILGLATRVPLLLCLILSVGPALAMDGSLSSTTDSLAPASVIAKRFETSYHLGSESGNTYRMHRLWVLEEDMADRDSRISVPGSDPRRLAWTVSNDTSDAGITALSKTTGALPLERKMDSASGSLSKGHAVPRSEGSSFPAQSFTASVRGAVKTGVSLESSLWNHGRSFEVALVLNRLQSLLSAKLFLFRTEIMGVSAQVRMSFVEPSIQDDVLGESSLEKIGNRFALDSNGVFDRENDPFSCVSLSYRVTF